MKDKTSRKQAGKPTSKTVWIILKMDKGETQSKESKRTTMHIAF